ncbi:N-acetylmuramoyl-L-alanine amidase [Clostridium hydrogeniformans]|uniref:N-acetylmuramoyl-L-alanine amidase n=1 Tax=Clostridium hydrogeniformans TaxID=349933 RepID=UPI00068F0117|nr:N-acetylmuramoyl-L-alanine amidase [Clostridium hydrogeniformans]
MKISVDFGHCLSGADTGAASQGYREEILTREVGKIVVNLLKKAGHDVLIVSPDSGMTSVSQSLQYRVNKSNNWGADFFVSIHFNSGGGYGTEIYTFNGKIIDRAKKVLDRFTALGYINRGIKDGSQLAVVKGPSCPSMLVECCFIDTNDMERYSSVNMGKIIAEGINGGTIEGSSNNSGGDIMDKNVYVQTKTLDTDGVDGIQVNKYMEKFLNKNFYVKANGSGILFESQYMTLDEANKVKSNLGDEFLHFCFRS